jgi:hypothetical protein
VPETGRRFQKAALILDETVARKDLVKLLVLASPELLRRQEFRGLKSVPDIPVGYLKL